MKIDLLQEFLAASKSAASTAEVIPYDPDFLNATLLKLIEGDESVLLALSNDLDPQLFSRIKKSNKIVTDPTKEQLKTIKTGITDVFCGVASTGSVCLSITAGLSVPVSMLTQRHIAIVDRRTIVPRPRDVFSEEFLGGQGLRRSLTFVTGPSATADMGPLVRGVHGPGHLHIVVLN